MSLILSGTDGLSDVDGSAATPAIRGTDANTGIFFPAADTIAFAEGGAEVARFDSSGNFGLGTTSPATRLTVAASNAKQNIQSTTGTNEVVLYLTNTGGDFYLGRENSAGTYFTAPAYSANLYSSGAYPMLFWTNGTERARIASGGQFCVNTTNTNGAFNVSGNVYLFSQSAGAGTHFLKWNSGTGQVTYDSSSRLVKDNIVDSTYGLAEVMQLKSRKYFRTDDQREEIGLVADEVQLVLPEFVPMSAKSIFTGDEADTELVPSGVYYEKLSSVLIKAIQEQQAIIDSLKARLDAANL